MKCSYSRTCYEIYQNMLATFMEPLIKNVSKKLKLLKLPEDLNQQIPEFDGVHAGTTLFELYLEIKRFAEFG